MSYFCRDCSYRGKVSGQGGECPACGSRAIVVTRVELEEQKPPATWRLVLLAGLWGTLIIMIIRKLLH